MVITEIQEDTLLELARSFVDIAVDEDIGYDKELLLHLESACSELSVLIELPKDLVIRENTLLSDIYPDASSDLKRLIKTYLVICVRLSFDPPTNSSILQSLEKTKLNTASNILVLEGQKIGENATTDLSVD